MANPIFSHLQSAGDRPMNFEAREVVMHLAVACMRFPGPNYLDVLRWLHEELKPATYLEIAGAKQYD
jgi:hypothetical protein